MHVSSSCVLNEIYVSEFRAIYGFFILNMYKIALVYFHLQLELELSPFDIISDAVGCMVEQILGIELLNFFDHQCQMLPISYHNKGTAFW